MQFSSFLYSFYNHSCQFANLTLWIFLNYCLKAFDTSVAISIVQTAQTINKNKFRTMLSQWETFLGYLYVVAYHLMPIVFESLICHSIKRVFKMFSEACIFCKVGVGEQCGVFALREICFQMVQT